MSNSCKYCFQTDHTIETCKTILCRTCKELGHPHWLCKGKDNKKKTFVGEQKTSKMTVSTSNTSLNKMSSGVKKDTLTVIPIQTTVSTPIAIKEVKRDMQFYLKQSTKPWSSIL
jgi:hypothetical protein